MKLFEPNKPLQCPYCSKSDGEPAEDYVVPGSFAHTTEMCGHCDQEFFVRRRKIDGKIAVTSNASAVEIYIEGAT